MYNDDVGRILNMADKDYTNAINGLREVAYRNSPAHEERKQAVARLAALARNEAPPRKTTALGNAARGGGK